MSERFIKFIPSEEAMYLLTQKGHAFRLLTIIAEAARRYEGGPDGLHIGEAFIGGHEKYDMSEQNYRTAKKILEQRQHLKIIETNRTRKKSTTGVTTEGTKVKLLSSNVWDINLEVGNDRTNDCLTTDQRLPNDKQEREECKERKEDKNIIAQSAPRLRKKDALTFNFEIWKFEGISHEDRVSWKAIYAQIDLDTEILKAAEWLKSNPSKQKKSLWRKFLTGWLGRANERLENKKAFQQASQKNVVDRRTRNPDGTPVISVLEGLF